MFGKESLPTIVYSYGCKAPHENRAYAEEQISLAHRYRNKLVELERLRRQKVQEAVRLHCPGLLELETRAMAVKQALADEREKASKSNAEARRRKVAPELRASIASLKAESTTLWTQFKALRTEGYQRPEVQAALEAIEEQNAADLRAARASCGLYYGTYLAIEAANSQSRSSKGMPGFKRWTGDGKCGCQVQLGITPEQAMSGTDTRLQIRILNPEKKKPHAEIKVRVGSNDKGKPIFATVRARYHRPLPEGCRIKWAYLVRRRTASSDKWSVQLIISRAGGFPKHDLATTGRVGINLGWRQLWNGLRVATWIGSDGRSGELIIPNDKLELWSKPDSLTSIRDLNFNTAMLRIRAFVQEHETELPEWWQERAQHMAQWQSQNRLASLIVFWRNNRFEGDTAIYDELEAWRKQDKHLWLWECHLRKKLARWRKEMYRLFAVHMRRSYEVAVIDGTDRKKLARLPEVESEDLVIAKARYNQRIAATGLLSESLKAFGPRVESADPKHITQKCHVCGHVEAFDAVNQITHACKCGAVWDQDVNAAQNLLALEMAA